MTAYEEAIRHTSGKNRPWFVIPANAKWFSRLVVAAAIVDALDSLDLQFPDVDRAKRREIAAARRALEAEAPGRSRGRAR
jgi:hypothetical protein